LSLLVPDTLRETRTGYVPWGLWGRAVQSVEYREFYYESGTTSRRYAHPLLAASVKRWMPVAQSSHGQSRM